MIWLWWWWNLILMGNHMVLRFSQWYSPLKVNRPFGGTCRLHLQGHPLLATCFHAAFLLGLFFDPEDGGDMFLRKVGWLSTDYMALYPRRYNFNNTVCFDKAFLAVQVRIICVRCCIKCKFLLKPCHVDRGPECQRSHREAQRTVTWHGAGGITSINRVFLSLRLLCDDFYSFYPQTRYIATYSIGILS
jgi:hypothetical protein